MKIGIEGQRLFRTKKHGMDMVALELIRNLQEIDHENEYVIFVAPDEDDSVLKETPNFKIVKLEGGFYPLWEQFALPKAASKAGCEILHCTSNTAPINCDIPLVVTLHDIIYMESSYRQVKRQRYFVPEIWKCVPEISCSAYYQKKPQDNHCIAF